MPFKSQAQRAYLYATHPDVAAEFQAATPKDAKLPKHAKPKAPTEPEGPSDVVAVMASRAKK